MSNPRDRGRWGRRSMRIAVLFLLVVASVEVAFRLFMAIQIGPRALLYGTPYFRDEVSVARRKHTEWRATRGAMPEDAAPSPSSHADVRSGYSKYFPYETKVDVDDGGARFSYRLNNHGMRGPDFATEKIPDLLRIIVLGASSTYGYGSRDDETYPSRLQQELNVRCKSERKYEVINFGIPHLTSTMIRELFIAEGLPLAPDVVVFYEGINDASKATSSLSVEGIRGASRSVPMINQVYAYLIPAYRRIRDYSMTLLFVDNMVQVPSHSTPTQVVAYRTGERVTTFLANVAAIRGAATESGALFIAVSQQAKSFLVPRDAIQGVTYAEEKRRVEAKIEREGFATLRELFFVTHADLMTALRDWVRAENIPFVDAIERLDRRRDLLYTYVHLNAQGNALLAEAIADEILQKTCR